MDSTKIRSELDQIIKNTTSYNKSNLPNQLLQDLAKWRWGSYGWVSPASLMFTAAWRKYYYPDVDCCKIWAADENNRPIPGGYSIRTEDETISIPLLAKYDLCEGFCSPNSGMQGSRAIEKMRTLKRLNKDFDNAQRTLFDLKLFASIMNQINDLEHSQLLDLIKFFICTSKAIQAKRYETNTALSAETTASLNVINALSDIPDPELTKCVVAACFSAIFDKHNFDNDWYEYVEYGTTNPDTIFLQQNGFSREASIFIQTPSNYSKYVTEVDGEKKIRRSILKCGNIGVGTEAQDIQFNIPELFVD